MTMKKAPQLIIALLALFAVSSVWAQGKVKNLVKDAVIGEKATYKVNVKSEFGKSQARMDLEIMSKSITQSKIKKNFKVKGSSYVKTKQFPITGDLVSQLKRQIRENWASANIKTKEVTRERIRLDKSASVKTIKKRGSGQKPKKSESSKSSFSCFRITFEVKGKYPHKVEQPRRILKPQDATMTITYWVSEDVPVFGLVKSEATITRQIQKKKITIQVVMNLVEFTEVKE